MKNSKKDPALKMPTPAELGGEQGFSQLRQFLIESMKDIYWAENQLLKSIPTLRDSVTTPELKLAFEEHLIQTQDHVKRLEEGFKICGVAAEGKKCEAMAGLVKESEEIIQETEAGSMTRDAAIILAAQKVEHYEIATYGSLVEFARTLGLKPLVGLLHATLDEEKQTNQGLSLIAQTGINWNAEHEAVSTENLTH